MKIICVDNAKLAEKIFRFRYEMYVQYLQWFKREDYPEGLVRDNFDKYSHNYVGSIIRERLKAVCVLTSTAQKD